MGWSSGRAAGGVGPSAWRAWAAATFAVAFSACGGAGSEAAGAAAGAGAAVGDAAASDAAASDAAASDAAASDAAASDAPTSGDAAADGAGGAADASAALQLIAPQGARRGPIELRVAAALTPAQWPGLQVEFDAGQGWSPATLMGPWQPQGGGAVVAWDSFADVSADGPIAVRVRLGASQAQASLEVRNAADTPRLVLTAHPSIDLPSGASAPRNTEVSALRWLGAQAEGAAVKLQVGKGPMELHAAPHGRATALIADFDGTFWWVRTPLDGQPSGTSVHGPFALPHGQPSDLAWSADGRSLYVLGSKGDGPAQPAALWRYQPAEDLSALGNPAPLATFDRPAMAVSVERKHPADRGEWAYVVLGPGASAKVGQLAAVQGSGGLAAPLLDSDVGVPNDLAVSPAGGLALLTSDLFGNEIVRYALGNPLQEVARSEPKRLPYHVVFHPASLPGKHVALVSNLDKNAVTPLVVSDAGISEGPAVTGVSLAAELDLIERGSHSGLALVSALNQLVAVQLSANGTATKLGVAYAFGSGTTNFTGAVAIQR